MRRPRGPGGRFLTAAEIAAGMGGQQNKEENANHDEENPEGTSPTQEDDAALHPTAESESAPSPDIDLHGPSSIAGNTNTATTDTGTPRSGREEEEEGHIVQEAIVAPEDLDPGLGADAGFITEQLQTFDGAEVVVGDAEGAFDFDPAVVTAGVPKFAGEPQLPIAGVDATDGFGYTPPGKAVSETLTPNARALRRCFFLLQLLNHRSLSLNPAPTEKDKNIPKNRFPHGSPWCTISIYSLLFALLSGLIHAFVLVFHVSIPPSPPHPYVLDGTISIHMYIFWSTPFPPLVFTCFSRRSFLSYVLEFLL